MKIAKISETNEIIFASELNNDNRYKFDLRCPECNCKLGIVISNNKNSFFREYKTSKHNLQCSYHYLNQTKITKDLEKLYDNLLKDIDKKQKQLSTNTNILKINSRNINLKELAVEVKSKSLNDFIIINKRSKKQIMNFEISNRNLKLIDNIETDDLYLIYAISNSYENHIKKDIIFKVENYYFALKFRDYDLFKKWAKFFYDEKTNKFKKYNCILFGKIEQTFNKEQNRIEYVLEAVRNFEILERVD